MTRVPLRRYRVVIVTGEIKRTGDREEHICLISHPLLSQLRAFSAIFNVFATGEAQGEDGNDLFNR